MSQVEEPRNRHVYSDRDGLRPERLKLSRVPVLLSVVISTSGVFCLPFVL
jgi:hypothetical protein